MHWNLSLYRGKIELQDTSKRASGFPSHIDTYTRPPLNVVPLYNTPCNGALCRKAPLYTTLHSTGNKCWMNKTWCNINNTAVTEKEINAEKIGKHIKYIIMYRSS